MGSMRDREALRVFAAFIAFGPLTSVFESRSAVLEMHACAAQAPSHHSNTVAESGVAEAEKDFNAGRLDEALAKCRAALKSDPGFARAYRLAGLIALQRNELDTAKEALLQSVRLDPSSAEVHVDLGKLYIATKQWRASESEFEAAAKLGDASGASEFGSGLALAGESRLREAIPHLTAAVRADPRDPEKLFTLVATEFQAQQMTNAERHLAQMEKLAPDDPWLWYRLGNLLKEYRQLDAAEAKLGRAIELIASNKNGPPEHRLSASGLRLELAWLRFERHDYVGARQALEGFEANSSPVGARVRALEIEGGISLATGEVAQAQRELGLAAELEPSQPDHYFHWAWALLMAGDIESAMRVALAAKSRWPEAPEAALLVAVIERERMPERARVPFSADWHLKGEGAVCCPCRVPCPCRSNGAPTHAHCESTGVYRITQGHYGNISLEGFAFSEVGAEMGEQGLPQSLYVDSSASVQQLIALERIFQSFQPLRPFVFLDVKRVPLAFVRPDAKTYEVSVPGLFTVKIRRELDENRKPLLQTAALDHFSNQIEYARNLVYKVWGPEGGLRWDYSGRQANYRTIDLDARDYRDRTMLSQFADGFGSFNKKQLELIKSLRLPTLSSYSDTVSTTSKNK
jgi:Tfp pilus assembly protein PilF